MPAFGANDLQAFCRAMGVPVTFGTVSTYPNGQPVQGLLDTPMQSKLGESGIGGVEAVIPELRLPNNAFTPMPGEGDTLLVDGTEYTVNAPTAEDDGGFLVYELFET